MTFEEAMQRLETLAEKIRQEDTTLEEAIACYEEGQRCYTLCETMLAEAEQKITVVSR